MGGPAWQLSFGDFQASNINHCFIVTLFDMKMRWGVLTKEHLNDYSIENADGWHVGIPF